MKNNTIQIIVAVVFVVLICLLTDPFMLFMPPMAAMAALLCAVIVLCVWSGLVLNEQVTDEREVMHRMLAGRVAYLSALAFLTTALLVQGLSHHIDPWIGGTLVVMVLSKLGARLYFDVYK